MRALLFLIGLVVLGVVAAMLFGLISIDMTRPAAVQAPAFEADVGRIDLGTTNRTVELPTVDIERADNVAN